MAPRPAAGPRRPAGALYLPAEPAQTTPAGRPLLERRPPALCASATLLVETPPAGGPPPGEHPRPRGGSGPAPADPNRVDFAHLGHPGPRRVPVDVRHRRQP